MKQYLADAENGESIIFEAHDIYDAELYCFERDFTYVGELHFSVDDFESPGNTFDKMDQVVMLSDTILRTAH